MGTSLSHSLMSSHVVEDPTVRAELYTWSSVDFRDEHALVYTSRSNPSQTCIFHYRVNPDKVLLTFHDCLCDGNTVRIDMEFVGDRDYTGFFVFRYAKANESSGSFIEKRDQPSLFLLRYQDKIRQRNGQLGLYRVRRGYEVQFNTGFDGGSILTCFIRVLCHPLKGLDVDLSGPHCEYEYYNVVRPIGLCYLNHVSGRPTHDVVKEKKQAANDVGASTFVSTQSTAILNAGQTQGNFNGSNFRDCNIVIDTQAMQFKGFHYNTT